MNRSYLLSFKGRDYSIQGGLKLAEWVTYKNHQIKACSQSLGDDRWMPKALAWLSMGGRAPMKTLQGESHEVSNTESKANVIALGKAKKWVDQHQ